MVTITSTLVIGVGGTGKSALWDLRARLQARYGSFKDLPMIGYLSLDTAKGMDQALSSTGLLQDTIRFAADEELHLTISETQMSDIKEHLEDHYPHLAEWVERDALRHPAVVEGAGTVRQIGRLALLTNIDKVKAQIASALKFVTSDGAKSRTLNYLSSIGVNNPELKSDKVKIFVVGSLIGGTGSGMFLDVGYLLRHDEVKHATPAERKSTAFLVLPLGAQDRNAIDTRASAYSALMELNHFSDHGTEYQVRHSNGPTWRSEEPPFDYTFLLTLQNKNVGLGSGKKLVEMIGQRLFLEAASPFSQQISDNRDNIVKFMTSADLKGCNQHFLSFGLSTLELPVRAVARTCGARFMGEVMQELRAGKFATEQQELKIDPAFLQGFLVQHGLSEEKIRETLLGELEKEIRDSFAGCGELTSKGVAGQLVKLEGEIEKDTTPRQGEGGVDGRIVQRIEEKARFECQRCEARLTRLVTELTGRPDGRLLYARKFLELLKQHLEALKLSSQQKAENLKKREQMGKLAVQRGRAELAEIASDWLLGLSPWQKPAYREAFEQRYGRDVMAWVRIRLERLLLRSEGMLGYLDRLLQAVEELQRRTRALDDHLSGMESTFQALESESLASHAPVNGKLVSAESAEQFKALVDQKYLETLGNALARRERLESFFSEQIRPLLQDKEQRPDIFLIQREVIATKELCARLWREASRKIEEWGKLSEQKVLDEFFKVPAPEAEFERVLSLSAPFLTLPETATHYSNDSGKEQSMVAYGGAGGSAEGSVARLRQMCLDRIEGVKGAPDKKLIDSGDPTEVIFFKEYGAFPLRLWNHLGTMEQAYQHHLRTSTVPLHLFKRGTRFVRINKQAPEDVDRKATLFLVASIPEMEILRPVTVDRKQKLRLEFLDARGRQHRLDFGEDPRSAADLLLEEENQECSGRLEREISRRREELGDHVLAALLRKRQNFFLNNLEKAEERKWRVGLLESYLKKHSLHEFEITEAMLNQSDSEGPTPKREERSDFPKVEARRPVTPVPEIRPVRPDGPAHVPTNGGALHEEPAAVAVVAPEAVAAPSPAAQKQCVCGEMVNAAARICRHCKWDFEKNDYFQPGT